MLTENTDSIRQFQQRQATAIAEEVELWSRDALNSPSDDALPLVPEEDTAGLLPVNADLNGSVWKVLVSPGDTIAAGQPVVIVEAMKMELTISSPAAGVVSQIACQPGRQVAPGDVLLWLAGEEQ